MRNERCEQMTDYARKISEQLVNAARVEREDTGVETDWRVVVAAGVRAGYGRGRGVLAITDDDSARETYKADGYTDELFDAVDGSRER